MTLNLFDQALAYHQQGLLEQAEKIYQQLLTINANNADVLHLYGILQGQKGDFEKAQELILKALKIDQHSPTYHNSLGNVLGYLEKFSEAIAHYEQSIELQPNSPATHNNLGNLYLKTKQVEKAIKHYLLAIDLKPDYADAHFNLAIIQIKKNELEKAKQHLEKAISLEPNFKEAHGQLAQLLQQEQQLEKSLLHYQQRLQLEPDHVDTLLNIGAILVKQGDLHQGITYFKKVLEIDSNYFEAHYNLGSTLLSLEKPDEALQHYLQGLTLQRDADAYYNVGVIYMYKERHYDAIDYFNSALSIRPNYLEAHLNLGATFLKLEDYANAIAHYQQALKLQPDNPEIQYILSAISGGKKSPTAAPEQYIKNLYDQYAPYFEQHLTKCLNYQGHTLLYQFTVENLKQHENLTIVDLGCGTGMCGFLFKPHAKKLIGIDISAKMLEVADKKNIYDELVEADITHALEQLHDIDLIVAADVFGYIGDLDAVFNATNHALSNKGYFAFTVEKLTGKDNFALQKSTRFAHTMQYIQDLARQHLFKIIKQDEIQLRMQRRDPVYGYIFLLQKVVP